MQYFNEQIEISAPDHVVFDLIDNLNGYSSWNSWIYHAEGSTAPGGAITVKMNLNGKARTFSHRMISRVRPGLFHWRDAGWFTLFAQGERERHITPLGPNRCLYKVELRIGGIAQHIANLLFGDALRKGLHQETLALKREAEQLFTK